MTPEKLEKILANRDSKALVQAMEHLSEEERRALGKIAAGALKQARATQREAWNRVRRGDISYKKEEGGIKRAEYDEQVSELAVLGLCGFTEAKKVTLRGWMQERAGEIAKILEDRRPEWIDKWVEKELEGGMGDWEFVHDLVRRGIAPKPQSDLYITRMLQSSFGVRWGQNITIESRLHDDPEILEVDLWRIFEIDFGRDAAFPASDLKTSPEYSLTIALKKVADADAGRRARLLSGSARALHRRMQTINAAWLTQFHDYLEPTPAERIGLQSHYIDLLSNTLPAVVGFAIDALKVVAKEKQLDVAAFARAVPPVFEVKPKSQPAGALQILKLASKQSPDLSREIALAAVRGLAHPQPDVQKGAIDLLESLAALDESLAAEMAAFRESVAASQRDRFDALLSKMGAASAPAELLPQENDLAALLGEARAIPPVFRKESGIDALLAAIESRGPLRAVIGNPMAVPRLDPADVIAPIQDFGELVERLSAGFEELEDADELERLLDGLSRLGPQRPDDFAQRTGALAKRAADVMEQYRVQWQMFAPTLMVRALISHWFGGNGSLFIHRQQKEDSALRFLWKRASNIAHRLKAGTAMALLALPTHKGGWIDPRVLVARMIAAGNAKSDRFDFIQALLRLAPEHRSEALAQASVIAGEDGDALRFALGGKMSSQRSDIAIWIAAGRARDQEASFPEFAADPKSLGPDAAVPATISWQVTQYDDYGIQNYATKRWTMHTRGMPPFDRHNGLEDRPTVLLHYHDAGDQFTTRCYHAIWPARSDATMAAGVECIFERIDGNASTFSPTAVFFEPLFDPAAAFTEVSQLATAVAMAAKDTSVRGMVTDLLITLIADGRCDGREMATVILKLIAAWERLNLKRVADLLREVARASALHRHVMTSLVEAMLAGMFAAADDLYHLLEPLREWLLEDRRELSKESRMVLTYPKGSGKSAKLAKEILAIAGESGVPDAIYAEALRGRIARAHKWIART